MIRCEELDSFKQIFSSLRFFRWRWCRRSFGGVPAPAWVTTRKHCGMNKHRLWLYHRNGRVEIEFNPVTYFRLHQTKQSQDKAPKTSIPLIDWHDEEELPSECPFRWAKEQFVFDLHVELHRRTHYRSRRQTLSKTTVRTRSSGEKTTRNVNDEDEGQTSIRSLSIGNSWYQIRRPIAIEKYEFLVVKFSVEEVLIVWSRRTLDDTFVSSSSRIVTFDLSRRMDINQWKHIRHAESTFADWKNCDGEEYEETFAQHDDYSHCQSKDQFLSFVYLAIEIPSSFSFISTVCFTVYHKQIPRVHRFSQNLTSSVLFNWPLMRWMLNSFGSLMDFNVPTPSMA